MSLLSGALSWPLPPRARDGSIVRLAQSLATLPPVIFLAYMVAALPLAAEHTGPYLLQRTVFLNEGSKIIARSSEGDVSLLRKPAHPASLFKIVILEALLRRNRIDIAERLAVEHRISQTPVSVRLATFRSSNLAFTELAKRLPAYELRQDAESSGFFLRSLPQQFGTGDAIYRAEDHLTRPDLVHDFMNDLVTGRHLQEGQQSLLLTFLEWPGHCKIQHQMESGRLYAKTGAWAGSAWITGFCRGETFTDVVTVYMPYELPHWRPARERAIRLFYARYSAEIPSEVF